VRHSRHRRERRNSGKKEKRIGRHTDVRIYRWLNRQIEIQTGVNTQTDINTHRFKHTDR
jgi:hypothetical protein